MALDQRSKTTFAENLKETRRYNAGAAQLDHPQFDKAPEIVMTPVPRTRIVDMVKFRDSGTKGRTDVDTTPLLQLPLEKKIPDHLTWLPIRSNLMVEDETVLRHIPYIHDDDPEASKFIEELNDYYDDNMIVSNEGEDGPSSNVFDDDEALNEILVELTYQTAKQHTKIMNPLMTMTYSIIYSRSI